jgi:hypothetical protein
MELTEKIFSIPLLQVPGGPGGGLVGVTLVAGVGGSQFVAQVRPGDADAVIAAGIHHHVSAFVHVALKAAGSLFGRIVEMVFPGTVFGGHVATVAKGIPLDIDLAAMGFMTILTDHPGLVHFALEEGSVDIYLFQDLPICKIEIFLQQGGPVGIEQRSPMVVILGGHRPAGMAPATHLDQLVGLPGNRSPGRHGIGIKDPGGIVGILQTQHQSHVGIDIRTAAGFNFFGPVDVRRSWPVTGFAAHIYLRPGGVISLFAV